MTPYHCGVLGECNRSRAVVCVACHQKLFNLPGRHPATNLVLVMIISVASATACRVWSTYAVKHSNLANWMTN